ncbi:MAG: copper amine oxidase N-terminal domain-containing protein, partial [Firmicutes bacterium]|nr:copper amine oxidase N-terminal domain-containing protein [Bacillota bacterium]
MRKVIVACIVLFTLTGFLLSHNRAGAEPNHTAIFAIGQGAYTADGIARAMDAEAFMENDRIYVPMRYLALSLGVAEENIVWDASGQSVTLTLGDVTMTAAIGDSKLYLNGQPLIMDAAPV